MWEFFASLNWVINLIFKNFWVLFHGTVNPSTCLLLKIVSLSGMLIFHPVVLLFNLISCDMFQPVVIFKHYTTLFYLNKYVAGIKYIFFLFPFFCSHLQMLSFMLFTIRVFKCSENNCFIYILHNILTLYVCFWFRMISFWRLIAEVFSSFNSFLKFSCKTFSPSKGGEEIH